MSESSAEASTPTPTPSPAPTPPPAPSPPPAPAPPAAEAQSGDEKPPWGSEDEFNPEKAWNLIQNLRADKERLSSRPALSEEQQRQLDEYNALVEASKTEAQRREEAEAAARRDAEQARNEANVLKVALKHGLSEEDFDLLGTGSIEQIDARAQKIAAKNEAAKQAALEAAVQPGTPAPRRPTEQLRPGASPSPDPLKDDSYYPPEWLSPTQRAAVQQAQGNSA